MTGLKFTKICSLLEAKRDENILFYRKDLSAVTVKDLRSAAAYLAQELQKIPEKRAALPPVRGDLFVLCLYAALAAQKEVVLLPENDPSCFQKYQNFYDFVLSNKTFPSLLDPDKPDFKAAVNSLTKRAKDSENIGSYKLPVPDLEGKILFFTSGSTGDPKPVSKTLAVMEQESRMLFDLLSPKVMDTMLLATVYPGHLYGMTARIMLPLCFSLPSFCDMIHYTEELCALSEGSYLLVTSPVFLAHLDLNLVPPRHIKVIISAGGFLDDAVAQRVQQWSGAEIFEIYGSTESGVMGWRWRRDPLTQFSTFPKVYFLKKGRHFVINSPLVPSGEHRISDYLEFFPDGTFHPAGRLDAVVKIDEKRINLAAVKKIIEKTPEVAEAAVVSYSLRERTFIGAVIVPAGPFDKDAKTKLQKIIKNQVAVELGIKARPRRIIFVDKIPANSMGKYNLAKLRELFDVDAAS